MKKTNFIFLILFSVLIWVTSGCSSDDDPISDEITGTWYGTRTYYNPVGGTKYQYLTITLNADHTGNLEYESPVSYTVASFMYSVSGSTIDCKGAYANSDGEYSDTFMITLKKEGNRLIPQDRYTSFILTKDNSVMTGSDGNEVASDYDKINMLENVWVTTDGRVVINFYSDKKYDEYTLTSPGSNQYKSRTSGSYTFSPGARDLLSIIYSNGSLTQYTVDELTESRLKISTSNQSITYRKGTTADIPKEADLKGFLVAAFSWTDKSNKHVFSFASDNKMSYFEVASKKLGSYGYPTLRATGTFSVSGSKVTAYFNDVSWEGGKDMASNYFPDWEYGKSCTKTYNIEVTASGSLKVTLPNSTVIYLDEI